MTYTESSPILGVGTATAQQIDCWFALTACSEITSVPVAAVTHPTSRMANCGCPAGETSRIRLRPGINPADLIARPMQPSMFRLRHDREVIGAIVGVVTVDVVHNLARRQKPSQCLFSDNAMFGNEPSASRVGVVRPVQINVPTADRSLALWRMPFAFTVDSQAFEGAVFAGGGAIGALEELQAADDACTLDPHVSHLSRVVPGAFAALPGFPICKPNSIMKGVFVASL